MGRSLKHLPTKPISVSPKLRRPYVRKQHVNDMKNKNKLKIKKSPQTEPDKNNISIDFNKRIKFKKPTKKSFSINRLKNNEEKYTSDIDKEIYDKFGMNRNELIEYFGSVFDKMNSKVKKYGKFAEGSEVDINKIKKNLNEYIDEFGKNGINSIKKLKDKIDEFDLISEYHSDNNLQDIDLLLNNTKGFEKEMNSLYDTLGNIYNNEKYKYLKDKLKEYFLTKDKENSRDLAELISSDLNSYKKWTKDIDYGNALNGTQIKQYEELFLNDKYTSELFKKLGIKPAVYIGGNDVDIKEYVSKHKEGVYKSFAPFAESFVIETKAYRDAFKEALETKGKNKAKDIYNYIETSFLKDLKVFEGLQGFSRTMSKEKLNKIKEMADDYGIDVNKLINSKKIKKRDLKDLEKIVKKVDAQKDIILGHREQMFFKLISNDMYNKYQDSLVNDYDMTNEFKKVLLNNPLSLGFSSSSPFPEKYAGDNDVNLIFLINKKDLKDYIVNNVGFFKIDQVVYNTGYNNKNHKSYLSFHMPFDLEEEITLKNYWRIDDITKNRAGINGHYNLFLKNISKDEYLNLLKRKKGKKK